MANRVLRNVNKNINYAEFSKTGRKAVAKKSTQRLEMESEVEEGQILDSPLSLQVEEDSEFNTASTLGEFDVNGDLLDYDDVGTEVYADSETIQEEEDITSEEVWQKRREDLNAGWEKREKLRLKLQRQKELAMEKLREEEERLELAKMDAEIKQLNAKRSVNLKTKLQTPRKKTVAGAKMFVISKPQK